MQLSTVNVVASFNLGVELKLQDIHASNIAYSRYDPKRFTGLTLKQVRPRTSVLLFSTGKAIILGAKSEKEALFGARKAARLLRSLDKNYLGCKVNDFNVKNVVVTARLPYKINLYDLARSYPREAVYEPELFMALIFKLKQPSGKAIVFEKGIINIVGINNEVDAQSAAYDVQRIIANHKKRSVVQ